MLLVLAHNRLYNSLFSLCNAATIVLHRPSTSQPDCDGSADFFLLLRSDPWSHSVLSLCHCVAQTPPSCPAASVVPALHLHCFPAAQDSTAPAPCPHCPSGLVLSVVLSGVAVKGRRPPAVVKPWLFTGRRLDRSSEARCRLNIHHSCLSVLFIFVSVWDL